MGEQWQTLYEAIGGEETVAKLVEAFYRRVAAHPDLRPIFPDDLTETARKQKQFLTQYLGGPPSLHGRAWTPHAEGAPSPL